jgi:hypothetical protein
MPAAHRWPQLSSTSLPTEPKAEAVSAGTEPGLKVHPEVLAAMQEIGIDLSLGRTLRMIGDFSGLNVPLQSVISKYRRRSVRGTICRSFTLSLFFAS